jgi:phosphoribosylformimino-5-aminoimidazole carboxamide ribotide isomerase
MLIYPAIDLIDGRCVRLCHGDFDQVTRYGDPVDQAKAFAGAGATWVHIVDLDGAKAGATVQTALISTIVEKAGLSVQCGGGVRAAKDVKALFEAGVARVVVGSVAARAPETVKAWLSEAGPEKLCCAFDVRPKGESYVIAVAGWRETTDLSVFDALTSYAESHLTHVLVTDITRDGDLTGPNCQLISALTQSFKALRIQASGGVASLDDLQDLRRAGAEGAIVGRALYEQRFSLEAALAS